MKSYFKGNYNRRKGTIKACVLLDGVCTCRGLVTIVRMEVFFCPPTPSYLLR